MNRKRQYRKKKEKKTCYNYMFYLFGICIALSVFLFLKGPLIFDKTNIVTSTDSSVTEEVFEKNKNDVLNMPISCNETEETPGFCDLVKKYADIVLSIVISISVALISVSATIFIFSKSALDRINDENHYMSDVVNVHKKNIIKKLVSICIGSAVLIILPFICHLFLTFKNEFFTSNIGLTIGLVLLGFAILIYFALTGLFWYECIQVEICLQKIIDSEYERLKNNLNTLLLPENSRERLALIGEWWVWGQHGYYKFINEGYKLCKSMTDDQYINQFQKLERLLLSERTDQNAVFNSTNVITIIQERINILKPNSKILEEDLKERFYRRDHEVFLSIKKFEDRIGFSGNRAEDSEYYFFDNLEKLYNILKDYRNLLVSEHYTWSKIENKSKGEEGTEAEKHFLPLFAQAYYYYFLRILAVFCSSNRIVNFSLNGSSLNHANFYSSTLENITFYSTDCYQTVFARVKFINVIMDISRFLDIDFYCVRIIESSFNNARFEEVIFERAVVQSGGFDSCLFDSCSLNNSDFIDCVFNNSVFRNTDLNNSNFSRSKFRDIVIQCKKTEINCCNFEDAEFYQWDAKKSIKMFKCDFSRSVWRKMTLNGWDLEGGVFDSADLSDIEITHSNMESASFVECHLDESILIDLVMGKSNLKNASIFGAKIAKIDFTMSDLSNIIAVQSKINNCIFKHCNCAEGDFSEASIKKSIFYAARLYDCSMTKSSFQECECQYLLADHLQFTFAECKNSDFSNSSLAESNMTQSKFAFCKFNGSDLTDLNATKTVFKDCELIDVDFSETRFVNTIFRANQEKYSVIRDCNFSDCKFENVEIKNIRFINCEFKNAIFIGMKFEDLIVKKEFT